MVVRTRSWPSWPDRKPVGLRTEVVMILDRSGSMAGLRHAAVSGFNEHLQEIQNKASLGGDTKLTLYTFSGEVKLHYAFVSPWSIPALTLNDYVPDGSTALLDAVGDALTLMDRESRPNDPDVAYLVIIVSDGEENASRRFKGSQIAEMVKAKQNSGKWTFVYVGSQFDLSSFQTVRQQWFVPYHNTITFDSLSPDSMQASYTTLSRSVGRYFDARAQGETQTNAFFDPENETKTDSSDRTT